MEINDINIQTSKAAEKDYMKLSEKNKSNILHKVVGACVEKTIVMTPPLKKFQNLKRIKCGNFRIVFRTDGPNSYEIYMIDDRKNIYPRIIRKEVSHGKK